MWIPYWSTRRKIHHHRRTQIHRARNLPMEFPQRRLPSWDHSLQIPPRAEPSRLPNENEIIKFLIFLIFNLLIFLVQFKALGQISVFILIRILLLNFFIHIFLIVFNLLIVNLKIKIFLSNKCNFGEKKIPEKSIKCGKQRCFVFDIKNDEKNPGKWQNINLCLCHSHLIQ